MITVHHLENSRSQRILWALEELGLPYEVQRYARDPRTSLAPPELRQVHPLGKSPVITDDKITVAESGAILEYLVDREPKARLRPRAGTAEHRAYVYWMHFAEGSAMPLWVMKLVFGKIRTARLPFFVRPVAKGIADRVMNTFVQPNIDRQMAFIDAELQQRPFFAGSHFSAADIQMSFPLEAAAARGGLAAYPAAADLLARLHARPAYQRALERGGPYSLLA